MPTARAPYRVARGCAVATVGLSIAAAGHGLAAASSPVPPLSPLTVLVAALVAAALVAASGRAWTTPRLVGALALVQVAVHGALWLDSGSGQVDPRLAGLAVDHHAHAHAAALWSAPMLAAHVVAVVVAAVLLARVDVTITLLVELARRLVVRRPAPAVPTRPRPVVVDHRAVRPASWLERAPIQRRGPPVLAASG